MIRTRKLIFHVLPILIAAGLVWVSLRGTDLAEFVLYMQSAKYEWLLPVVGITLLGHWIRAYRWQFLVAAIPEPTYTRIPLLDLFASLMIGYMVNYALPRAGEIARCTHLSVRKKISTSALLGTVVAERIVDILVLGLGLFITTIFLRERLPSLFNSFSVPQLPWEWIAACAVIIAVAIYIGLRLKSTLRLRDHIKVWMTKFVSGFQTVYRTPYRWHLIWTTIVMWLIYGLMAYIPLLMFDVAENLSYWDGLAIMFIGVLGILVPTPGGAGSFHYITIITLTHIYGAAESGAAAYAVFIHGAQLILYLFLGILILIFFRSLPTRNDNPTP